MSEQDACPLCGGHPEDGGYKAPLCNQCRNLLSHRPFPIWLKAISAVVLLITAFALSRFPATLRAAIAFERGQIAEGSGQYSVAIAEYQKVVERFPASTLALARLGIAHERAGNASEAMLILGRLSGREGSTQLVEEANEAMHRLREQISALEVEIEEYKTELNQLEERLENLWSTTESSSSRLQRMSERISNMEEKVKSGLDVNLEEYEALVGEYNNLVSAHNVKVEESDSLYKEYQGILKRVNDLIDRRTKLLSKISR